MSPQATRLLIVAGVIGLALIVAFLVRKLQHPTHPDLRVGDVGDRPGVVLFTSTDCSKCKEVIAMLQAEMIPFREVTHDLEPQRFETWDVLAVPLTVVLDVDGDIVGTMSGVPRRRTLIRSVHKAGIET